MNPLLDELVLLWNTCGSSITGGHAGMPHWLISFVAREAPWFQIPLWVMAFLFIHSVWAMGWGMTFRMLGIPKKKYFYWHTPRTPRSQFEAIARPIVSWGCEEAMVKLVPIALANHYFPNHLLLTIVVASFFFGIAHGLSFERTIALGFGNVITSILFLKCGGFHGHYAVALMASTAEHSIFNFLVFYLKEVGARKRQRAQDRREILISTVPPKKYKPDY